MCDVSQLTGDRTTVEPDAPDHLRELFTSNCQLGPRDKILEVNVAISLLLVTFVC